MLSIYLDFAPLSFIRHQGIQVGKVMSSSSGDQNTTGRNLTAIPACEVCRRLKMRCIRPQTHNNQSVPCERCTRNKRVCKIPESRPLGRKRGALGRYHGVEKAFRNLQSELKKSKTPHVSKDCEEIGVNMVATGDPTLDIPLFRQPNQLPHQTYGAETRTPFVPCMTSTHPDGKDVGRNALTSVFRRDKVPQFNREPTSNPLALLADASDAAQFLELHPHSTNLPETSTKDPSTAEPLTSLTNGISLSDQLLHQPNHVSIGLHNLDKDALKAGINTLLSPFVEPSCYSNYFQKSPPLRDVGSDVDPVDLGLVTMEEAYRLFPVYFARLHPVNGILDPILHSPTFVRSRSALLFTWILALTAQFDFGSAAIAKRLRLHGEKLSRHVHTAGYKSVEIVQGYYISLLSATPAATLAQERSWLYTMYAFGVATELGLDQEPGPGYTDSPSPTGASRLKPWDTASPTVGSDGPILSLPAHTTECPDQVPRLSRNRERTWLRILLWERANSATCGRTHAFPETELTRSIDIWWLHPLADATDKYTCAFIALRRGLALLQSELKNQSHVVHSNPHWVQEFIDRSLKSWRECWLSGLDASPEKTTSSEQLSNVFLRWVYFHGRLWTLSFALENAINGGKHLDAIRSDCLRAAVESCELAVLDLNSIGEPLYCLLAPTWAMIAYGCVLALKIFPALYGPHGNDVELLALVSQVATCLGVVGATTPMAGLLSQHLMVILRVRMARLLRALPQPPQLKSSLSQHQAHDPEPNSVTPHQPLDATTPEALISEHDPFLTSGSTYIQEGLNEEDFDGFLRDMFGNGFGGVF